MLLNINKWQKKIFSFNKQKSIHSLYPLLVEYCNPGKVCNRLKEAFPTS